MTEEQEHEQHTEGPVTTRGSTSSERVFDHVLRGVTLAAIIGGAVTLTNLSTEVAVLGTQISAVQERIADMRASSADGYTATEARRDLQPLLESIADHEARVRLLERQLRATPLEQ